MVDRKPSVIGTALTAGIYWGMLFYWLRDDLLDGSPDEQMRALRMFIVSIPYVAYIMWCAMTDLPDNIRDIPYIGRVLKPGIWLISVVGLAYWGWVDTAAVGFLLVGVALLGVAVAMCLVCLLYSGSKVVVYTDSVDSLMSILVSLNQKVTCVSIRNYGLQLLFS